MVKEIKAGDIGVVFCLNVGRGQWFYIRTIMSRVCHGGVWWLCESLDDETLPGWYSAREINTSEDAAELISLARGFAEHFPQFDDVLRFELDDLRKLRDFCSNPQTSFPFPSFESVKSRLEGESLKNQ